MSENNKATTYNCPCCGTAMNTVKIVETCNKENCNEMNALLRSGVEINSDNDICYSCPHATISTGIDSFISVEMTEFIDGRPHFNEFHKCNTCGTKYHFDNQDKNYLTFCTIKRLNCLIWPLLTVMLLQDALF